LNFNHKGKAQGADFNRERPLEIAISGRKVNGFLTAIVFGGGLAYIPLTLVTLGKLFRNNVQSFFARGSKRPGEDDFFPR
jgi:hypothetical protein